MNKPLIAVAIALALALPATAQQPQPVSAPSPGEIVAGAAAEDWVAIAPEDLVVMTLAPDANGKARQVVIQLIPAPFSQGWVENIRTLARAHWYDGIAVTRVQDNYVVQWGDPNGEDAAKAKALPEGLRVMGVDAYIVDAHTLSEANSMPESGNISAQSALAEVSAEMEAAATALDVALQSPDATEADHDAAMRAFLAAVGLSPPGEPSEREKLAMLSITATQTPDAPEGWHQRDSYAQWTEIWRGWPIANREIGRWVNDEELEVENPRLPRHEARAKGIYFEVEDSSFWPVHCYGMVGVGRNYSPDTGTGAELYTVIGHAPRHLDRNIALVGRVVEGIEHLSSLPRGTGQLGFYETPAEHTPIVSIRVASDLPEVDPASSSEAVGQQTRPVFQYLSTESEIFARYVEARANRRDPFFIVPARGADICNVPVPVRRVP